MCVCTVCKCEKSRVCVILCYAHHIQRLSARSQAFLALIRPGIIILWNRRKTTWEWRLNTNWMSIDLPSSNLCVDLQCTLHLISKRQRVVPEHTGPLKQSHAYLRTLILLLNVLLKENRRVMGRKLTSALTSLIWDHDGIERLCAMLTKETFTLFITLVTHTQQLFFLLFSSIGALFLRLTSAASLAVGCRLLGTRGAVWKRLMSFVSWPLI